MPATSAILIVGLGNPGQCYETTRHNAGYMALDELSARFDIPLTRKKFAARFGTGIIEGSNVILAKPLDFMNNSGPPMHKLSRFFRIPLSDLFVIHDDIDLAFGRLKIMKSGGSGGHKGIKSIATAFASSDFPRLRIGVGRPEVGPDVTNHVLGQFSEREQQVLPRITAKVRDAVSLVLKEGVSEGMNQVNSRKLLIVEGTKNGGNNGSI